MSDTKPDYFIAWNVGKSEGFITTDIKDCKKALGILDSGMSESALGAYFREIYEGDDFPPLQVVKVML